ncbi:MAG: hypothetical protein HYT42_01065 [Candidatus Sungbacteria bacterium]|nr:hypothetical protein [Candidatus Sungbacteria bacterium]
MGEVQVVAIVRRSLLRHLNGHLDRRLYANLVGERVVVVPGTERGEEEMASVEVVPLAALNTCPVRLRKIFLEVLSQDQPTAGPKVAGKLVREMPSRPAPRGSNGRGKRVPPQKLRPRVAFIAARRSSLRGLR